MLAFTNLHLVRYGQPSICYHCFRQEITYHRNHIPKLLCEIVGIVDPMIPHCAPLIFSNLWTKSVGVGFVGCVCRLTSRLNVDTTSLSFSASSLTSFQRWWIPSGESSSENHKENWLPPWQLGWHRVRGSGWHAGRTQNITVPLPSSGKTRSEDVWGGFLRLLASSARFSAVALSRAFMFLFVIFLFLPANM